MSWKSTDPMEQKKLFIAKWRRGDSYFNALCEEFGISRKTGYNLLRRYQSCGLEGLVERSSRPRRLANETEDWLIDEIVAIRSQPGRIRLGARKIRLKLLEKYDASVIPSATTIYNVLVRRGLIKRRRPRRRIYPMNTKVNPVCCNEIWTIDYKGHFKLGNGRRCHPLTIKDSYSSCLLRNVGHYGETIENVKQVLKSLFKENGLPEYLVSDNGSCFASIQSPGGYGSLSYWLMDHGVMPVFADPGKPGQNGRHERMHRELKDYCCYPAANTLRSQNKKLNEFKEWYNYERPHDGLQERLGQKYPGIVYKSSPLIYKGELPAADYGESFKVKKVSAMGATRWGADEWIMISRGLAGKYVGIKQIDERLYEVFYRWVSLGYFELGEHIEHGRYYRLTGDRDHPARLRDQQVRSRKSDE